MQQPNYGISNLYVNDIWEPEARPTNYEIFKIVVMTFRELSSGISELTMKFKLLCTFENLGYQLNLEFPPN
jgi:hypothetical protein